MDSGLNSELVSIVKHNLIKNCCLGQKLCSFISRRALLSIGPNSWILIVINMGTLSWIIETIVNCYKVSYLKYILVDY